MQKKYRGFLLGVVLVNGLFVYTYLSAPNKTDVSELIDDHVVLFVQGNYETYLKEVLDSKVKNDPEERYRVAMAAVKVGDLALAEKYYAKSYAYISSPLNGKIMKTLVLINKNEWIGAEKILQDLKSKNKQEQSVIDLLRGIILYEQNDLKNALISLQASEKNDETVVLTLVYIGRILAQQKKWKEALIYLERAEQLGYSEGLFLEDLAFVLYRTKNHAKAVDVYKGIVDKISGNSQYIVAYSTSLLHVDMVNEAVEVLDLGIKKDPKNLGLYRKKAQIYLQQQDPAKALAVYTNALPLFTEGESIEVMVEQMFLQYKLGNIEESNLLVKKIKESSVTAPAVIVLFTNRLYQRELYDDALEVINKLLAIKPDDKNGITLKRNILISKMLIGLRTSTPTDSLLVSINTLGSDIPEVLWMSALKAMHETGDIDLALRYLQIIHPEIPKDDIRINYARYLLREGASLSGVLEKIENKGEYLSHSHLLLRKDAVQKGNKVDVDQYKEKLNIFLPGLDENLLEEKLTTYFEIAPILSQYYDN